MGPQSRPLNQGGFIHTVVLIVVVVLLAAIGITYLHRTYAGSSGCTALQHSANLHDGSRCVQNLQQVHSSVNTGVKSIGDGVDLILTGHQ